MNSKTRKGIIIFAILIIAAILELAISTNVKKANIDKKADFDTKAKIAKEIFEEELKNDTEILDYAIKNCEYKNDFGDYYVCYITYDIQTTSQTTKWLTNTENYGANNYIYNNYLYITILYKNGNYSMYKTSTSQY